MIDVPETSTFQRKAPERRHGGNKGERSPATGVADPQLNTGKQHERFLGKVGDKTRRNRRHGCVCAVMLQRCAEDRLVAHMR